MYGFFNFSRMLGVWLVLFGALGMVAFMKWEMQVENPVLDLHLFKENKVFAFSSLATLINYSATFAVTFLLSLYLQYIKNLTPQKAGLILVFQPIVQAFCSPFAGKLSDRIEPRIVASTGMALTSIGLFLMAILSEKTGVGFVVANLILLGLGFAFFSSPNTNAVMQSVGNKSYGMASGTISTMRVIGMVFSMGITALMLSLFVGKVEITPEYFPAYLRGQRLGFLFFALLCVGGTLTSLARGKVSRPRS
jgi:MFS family permease